MRVQARGGAALVAVVLVALVATAAFGADDVSEDGAAKPSDEERLDEVEETVRIVVEELDRVRKIFAVPEDGELQSFGGLGPAASKVYFKDRGLSIGGYGEVRLRADVSDEAPGDSNVFDALRAILYVGYKFNDWIVMNGEYEFEHAGSGGGGSVSTEFLTLDFLFCECFNARAGLLLAPMGFVNEIHEPVFFLGSARPEVERRIIPSTWRENGAGVFGSLFDDRVQYRFYGINGFDAVGFSDNGLRGGRQKGSEALADHFAFVGRVDVEPVDGVLFGASVYTGKSGQNRRMFDPDGSNALPAFNVPDTLTTIWETHLQVKMFGAHFRGLYTQAHVQDSAQLSAGLGRTVAQRMVGYYGEVAYDILPVIFPDTEMSLEPFYRYEHLDTQDRVASGLTRNRKRDRVIHTVGLQLKPHPQVAIKVDYRNFDSASGELPDEVQASIGFVF